MSRRTRLITLLLPLCVIASTGFASQSYADSTTTDFYYQDGHAVTVIAKPDGRREVFLAHLADGVKTPPEAGSRAVIAEPGDCPIGGAYAWERRCGNNRVYWPGYHPTINFIDYTGANWPVYEAASVWNWSTALNAVYRPRFGCPGSGAFCVDVNAVDYDHPCGALAPNTWLGCTWFSFNGLAIVDASIEFDAGLGGTYTENRKVVCHEMGHALGLDHDVWNDSCLYVYPTWGSTQPNSSDFQMLESIY